MSSKVENENEKKNQNENDKTLMSSNEDDDNENENDKTLIIIKELNDVLDEIIDKSKSFEDQIKSIKKVESLDEYYSSTILVIKSYNLKSLN